jgi:hypothetical protein
MPPRGTCGDIDGHNKHRGEAVVIEISVCVARAGGRCGTQMQDGDDVWKAEGRERQTRTIRPDRVGTCLRGCVVRRPRRNPAAG